MARKPREEAVAVVAAAAVAKAASRRWEGPLVKCMGRCWQLMLLLQAVRDILAQAAALGVYLALTAADRVAAAAPLVAAKVRKKPHCRSEETEELAVD